jgi:hypothetical protein
MNKTTMIPALLLLAIVSAAYAIYRSTDVRLTVLEARGQAVYGEPQHGLILGLFILAGFCILGVVLMLLDRPEIRHKDQQPTVVSTRTATNYPQ